MPPRTLSQSGSVFLDCVRFATALVVVLGHLGRFFPVSRRLDAFTRLAHIAVCIFFVLSGFVIRMIVNTRVGSMREFLIDRASRIYSVTVPALGLTLLFEAAARLGNPGRYAVLSDPFSWSHVPLQMFTNLTFTAQAWGYETNPLSNSPFWSLSFECVYYVLFALLFFGAKRTSTRLSIALVCLVSGPAIVLLFPTWLLGCLLYDCYIWLDGKSAGIAIASGLLLLVFGGAAIFRHGLVWLLTVTDDAHRTAWLQAIMPNAVRSRFGDSTGVLPWLSRFSVSFYVAAIIVFVWMLWTLLLLDRFAPNCPEAVAGKLRWIAEGTFALYLLHLPLLLMISCLLPAPLKYPYLWVLLVIVFCILLSRPFDKLKQTMRRTMRRVFPADARVESRATARP
jgi:peptidoglycan/LPS O-acetylase OafA/YrhL